MGDGVVKRTAPGSGDDFGVGVWDDPLLGTAGVKSERTFQVGHPVDLIAIADAESSVPKSFPYDGATPNAAAADGTHITLASDAPAFDITGLLVLIWSGTGANQVRRITAYNTGTKQATVNRAWGTSLDTGSVYRLLVPCHNRNEARVKAEGSSSTATDILTLALAFYDAPVGQAGTAELTRQPRRVDLDPIGLAHRGHQVDVTKGGYYHFGPYAVISRGYLGYKVRVTAITSGSYSLWAGGS